MPQLLSSRPPFRGEGVSTNYARSYKFFFSDPGPGMPGCKKWVWESGLHVALVPRFPPKFGKPAPSGPCTTCDRLQPLRTQPGRYFRLSNASASALLVTRPVFPS